jgi:preprotein translocase subunit YajC
MSNAASPIVMMLVMFAIFYFILIRPQAKRQKEHQAMLQKLSKGDKVLTRGGIIGTISGVSEDNQLVTLEVQEKVRVQVPRTYLEGKIVDGKLPNAAGGSSAAA